MGGIKRETTAQSVSKSAGESIGEDAAAGGTTGSASTERTIVHVDINSYFATLLEQENPMLRGRAFGVVKEAGRTCLIATSKEAKKYGIATGTLVREARQRHPALLTVPASFDRYLDATKRLHALFKTLAPSIYIYSLDEAFIDITDCRHHLYPDVNKFGKDLQQAIRQSLGEWVTCSVGIATNRFLAKLASETAPPNSVQLVTAHNLDALLAIAKLADACGIGYRLQKKLRPLGVKTLYQLRFIPEEELLVQVGPYWARELTKMAWGEESHLLAPAAVPQEHPKSVSRSITGYSTTTDESTVRAVLLNLTEEVSFKLRRLGLVGRQVGVSLSGSSDYWSDYQTFQHTLRHTSELFAVIWRLVQAGWLQRVAIKRFPVIKYRVRVQLLAKAGQEYLLPAWQQQERASRALHEVNQKYGLFTLRKGRLLHRPLIKPEVTGFLGDAKFWGLR